MDEQPRPRSCATCGNYAVCEIRVSIPQLFMVDMEKGSRVAWPTGMAVPMPCGGSAWVDDASAPGPIVKRPDESWATYLERKRGGQARKLKELPD